MAKFVSQTETSLKKKKRRWTPKGRQVEDKYLDEVSKLFSGLKFKRDELIEYLHILQDKFGVLYDKHLVALSTIINLPLSEIYEVATFYAHFNIVKDSKIFKDIENNSHMYFVHSYEFVPNDKKVISATTDYSSNIVCSVEKENIFGTQFHPEKSDKTGLKIIDNFISL